MKAKRFNWKLVYLIGAVALIAIARFPEGGLSEVHNVESASNFALVDAHPRKDDWPCTRGFDGRNIAASDRIPTQWSSSDIKGWQVPLQGPGQSTPIVWGDQLFLITADPAAQRISLRSFSRESGRSNWQTVLHQGGLGKIPEKGTHASSTPACDGHFIFAVAAAQGSLWLTSVDLTGRIGWQREVGSYHSRWGYCSSPALYKNLVIVVADRDEIGSLTAFHRQTGEIIWRIKRPAGESFGIPVVAIICGKAQLILGGKGAVRSYDPATGNELWYCDWSGDRIANAVAFDSDHVFATNKRSDGEVICIKADGSGNVSKSHLAWRQPKIGSEFPSPLLHGEFLYIQSDEGLLTCLQASNGKVAWKKRIEGVYSASPMIAGDYLICCNQLGVSTIFRAGASGEIVSVNSLAEGIAASPVVIGNTIFVRTLSTLRCLIAPSPDPVAERPEPQNHRL